LEFEIWSLRFGASTELSMTNLEFNRLTTDDDNSRFEL